MNKLSSDHCGCYTTNQMNYCQLHAAAPDLLRACKAALMSLTSDEHYQEFKPLIMVLTDAVKKAGVK